MAALSLKPGLNIKDKRRPGRNQELVLRVLTRTKRPLGAYELLSMLREEGLRAPPQVYRALDQLVEKGLVHKIESLSAFARCVHTECSAAGNAIFAICEKCGRASEVHDPSLERSLRKLAQTQGFQTKSATVELSGICGACVDG